jgi:uncharacterized protein (DUF1810 family)
MATVTDPFDLQRFVDAQAPVFDTAMAELSTGQKDSHWMWFVFPQTRGLGRSMMSDRYAVGSLLEARAFLDHPVLGPRIRQAAELVTHSDASSLHALFGSPDDVKLISSMTLFALAAPGEDGGVFRAALVRWNGGRMDEQTQALVA